MIGAERKWRSGFSSIHPTFACLKTRVLLLSVIELNLALVNWHKAQSNSIAVPAQQW
jgi:hypothetical protein